MYNPSGLRLPLSGTWPPKYVTKLFGNLYAQNMQNLLLEFDFFLKRSSYVNKPLIDCEVI
jgi:hypothetical protein